MNLTNTIIIKQCVKQVCLCSFQYYFTCKVLVNRCLRFNDFTLFYVKTIERNENGCFWKRFYFLSGNKIIITSKLTCML